MALVKVLFAFEDTPGARQTLAAALEDVSWLDRKARPVLDIGFGMVEQEGLFILTKAISQHGATLLVVAKPVEKDIKPEVVEEPTPIRAAKKAKVSVSE